MANPAKQRLEALRVGEISLVDVPANEAPFLVVKRVEEPTMKTTDAADPKQPTQPTPPAQQPAAPTTPAQQQPTQPAQQPPDQNRQTTTEVKKADAPIAPELIKLHEALSTAYASDAVPDHMKPHIANMHETLRGLVAATPGAGDGPPSSAMTRTAQGEAPLMLPPLMADNRGAPSIPPLPTGKGMNAAMIKTAVEQSVEKIGRKMSAERLAKIKAGLGPFLELIQELDPECLPGLLGLPIVQAVQASAPASGDVEKKVEVLTEANATLQKRVQELEQIRGVSKALPLDTNATPQPTQKSFWNGVL